MRRPPRGQSRAAEQAPNPHSARFGGMPNFPRLRAWALLRRRPEHAAPPSHRRPRNLHQSGPRAGAQHSCCKNADYKGDRATTGCTATMATGHCVLHARQVSYRDRFRSHRCHGPVGTDASKTLRQRVARRPRPPVQHQTVSLLVIVARRRGRFLERPSAAGHLRYPSAVGLPPGWVSQSFVARTSGRRRACS